MTAIGTMAVGQAIGAFELFTGLKADPARVESHFKRMLAERDPGNLPWGDLGVDEPGGGRGEGEGAFGDRGQPPRHVRGRT